MHLNEFALSNLEVGSWLVDRSAEDHLRQLRPEVHLVLELAQHRKFPDQLAAAVESQLAVPWSAEALVKTKSIELRGRPWHERRQAVSNSMAARDIALLKDRCVLLVDDVTTSGATLCEAARVLRAAGPGHEAMNVWLREQFTR